jgi:hypothetical protein
MVQRWWHWQQQNVVQLNSQNVDAGIVERACTGGTAASYAMQASACPAVTGQGSNAYIGKPMNNAGER